MHFEDSHLSSAAVTGFADEIDITCRHFIKDLQRNYETISDLIMIEMVDHIGIIDVIDL